MSSQGRLEFSNTQFWLHARCPSADELRMFWRERATLCWTDHSLLAVLAGEAGNGSLEERPWLASRSSAEIKSLLIATIANAIPICERAEVFGQREEPLFEMLVHVVLAATLALGGRETAATIKSLYTGRSAKMPKDVVRSLRKDVVAPVLEIARRQLAHVCPRGCKRVDVMDDGEGSEDLAETYWRRFVRDHDRHEPRSTLRVTSEKLDEPCRAGLSLGRDRHCPLIEPQGDPSRARQLNQTLEEFERIMADIVKRRGISD